MEFMRALNNINHNPIVNHDFENIKYIYRDEQNLYINYLSIGHEITISQIEWEWILSDKWAIIVCFKKGEKDG